MRIQRKRDELGSVETVIDLADFEASLGVRDNVVDLCSAWLKRLLQQRPGNIILQDRKQRPLSETMPLPTTECSFVLGFCEVFAT